MECKLRVRFQSAARRFLELIDTLWNVNECCEPTGKTVAIELIDTLWNVNISGSNVSFAMETPN